MVGNLMVKRINKLEKQLEKERRENQQLRKELEFSDKFLSYYRNKSLAKELIKKCKQTWKTQADRDKVIALENTINAVNYRDYITCTKNGDILIDYEQFYLAKNQAPFGKERE